MLNDILIILLAAAGVAGLVWFMRVRNAVKLAHYALEAAWADIDAQQQRIDDLQVMAAERRDARRPVVTELARAYSSIAGARVEYNAAVLAYREESGPFPRSVVARLCRLKDRRVRWYRSEAPAAAAPVAGDATAERAPSHPAGDPHLRADAVEALVALQYKRRDAERAVGEALESRGAPDRLEDLLRVILTWKPAAVVATPRPAAPVILFDTPRPVFEGARGA